jgi:hypothetical protein
MRSFQDNINCLGLFSIIVLQLAALLPVHPSLDFLELALTSKELLSLFVDFTLHLDFDFAQLLLLATELLLLEADRLACKIFGVERRVPRNLLAMCICE